MKTSSSLVLAGLIATASAVAACSSDGTGTVPPGVYGGATGQFGGAIGTPNDFGGGLATGGSGNAGTPIPGGAIGTAGSPVGGGSPVLAGSTAITTIPSGGSTSILSIPAGGASAAGTTSPTTTVPGGSTSGGGRTTAGGTIAGGTTAAGGPSAAGGTSSVGGTTTRTGGATGAGTGGSASTGADNWWPTAFDANASPSPMSGKHNPGRACLPCHKTGGQGPAWLFGGTVYDKTESNGVAHVQVGIKEGGKFYSAYSATNGNIWMPPGTNTVTWANAEIRVRTATGEKKMVSFPQNGDCNNSCHVPGNRTMTP